MSFIGNLLWLVFGGFVLAFGYIVGGLVICMTIIGIPFGLQAIKLGVACLLPFGKETKKLPNADGTLTLVFNILWIVLFGWEIFCFHVVLALVCAITVVGIPFAVQHAKLAPLSLFPFGHDLE